MKHISEVDSLKEQEVPQRTTAKLIRRNFIHINQNIDKWGPSTQVYGTATRGVLGKSERMKEKISFCKPFEKFFSSELMFFAAKIGLHALNV